MYVSDCAMCESDGMKKTVLKHARPNGLARNLCGAPRENLISSEKSAALRRKRRSKNSKWCGAPLRKLLGKKLCGLPAVFNTILVSDLALLKNYSLTF